MNIVYLLSLLITLPIATELSSGQFKTCFSESHENKSNPLQKASQDLFGSYFLSAEKNQDANKSSEENYALFQADSLEALISAIYDNPTLQNASPLPIPSEISPMATMPNAEKTLPTEDIRGVPSSNTPSNAYLASISYPERSGNNNPGSSKAQNPRPALALIDFGTAYLRPFQGGTDFAETVDPSTASSDNVPYGTNKGLDFDFDWGWRVALGYQGADSNQTIKATYFHYRATAHQSMSFTPDPLTGQVSKVILDPLFLFGGNGLKEMFLSARSKWHLNFDMLDFTFSKKYAKKRCMSFEPFIGIKALSVWQKQNIYLTNQLGRSVKLQQKSDLTGVGAVAGLNLDWKIAKGFSLIGGIDGLILASKLETTRNSNEGIPTVLWVGQSSDYLGTPGLEGMIAFRSVYCWDSGRFIDFKIGFEEHYFFETLKHNVFNPDSNTDLSLMGWFATLGVGF